MVSKLSMRVYTRVDCRSLLLALSPVAYKLLIWHIHILIQDCYPVALLPNTYRIHTTHVCLLY